MCCAIFIPQGSKLPKEHLEQAFKNNSEGGGFAYIENGEVKIQKGFFKFEEMWDAFNAVQQTNNAAKLCHVRKKSYGKIDAENCHPFQIDAQHAISHNGTVWEFSVANASYSDTSAFTLNILKPLFAEYPEFYKTKYGRWLIEEAIGSLNKMIILDANGDYRIFNESEGHWNGAVWYSNKSYEPPPPPKKKSKKHKKSVGWYRPRNGSKKKRIKGYRYPNSTNMLTQQQMNELTHKFGLRMKDLARRGDVEIVPVD
jgi:glutamine amidotransferase